MLQISHFTKSYGTHVAVSDLSLDVRPGTVVGFIGHNGAGKSTTLRCAAGILGFDAGMINVGGFDLASSPLKAKRVAAFLPDNPDLYEFLSGVDYLTFIADIYGLARRRREELTRLYADAFGLTGDLGSSIGSYSHGMKQKLALISALIREPQLLMLDEPFVGLDAVAAHTLKGYLRALCDRGGAVLFSPPISSRWPRSSATRSPSSRTDAW